MGDDGSERRGLTKVQKSYFDVLGICCPSEVPLVEKVLRPLAGVHKISVIVPSKTVIVEHDPLLISQLQIVKALNQARLEATIRAYGTDKIINKWPSPYILACGTLLLVSLFQRFFHPLRWLAVAAVAIGLPPIVLRSVAAIRRFTLDINILMLIAVAGAVALRDFSEAGFIVFLFTIAEWLETMASHKATAGMSALMRMAPQKAILAETGQVVDARDVKVNTILAVKAGEVIPIDGVVAEGKSEVNEQSLTGESFPVAKQPQSLVWAGTLNIDGYISVKTTALAEDSAVARMARLVEEAQNSRSKTQRMIDSCAKYYTPAAVVIAGGVAVIPLMLRVHNPKHWFQLALVLLVSACPCALVLSTPVATFCALLKAARTGLLVKGGDVLEALARTKVVAFDKTGTITKGEFSVVELHPVSSQVTMNILLYWISSIESKSSHPMASALVDYSRSNSVEPKPDDVSEFQIYPGEGVYGEIDGKKIYIGNKRIAARAGCDSVPNPDAEEVKAAVTLGYVFSGATLIGMFTLSDSCRTGAAEAIRTLKSLGVKVAMLTGDSTAAATHAQNELGHAIEILHAELLPEDKVQIINNLKAKEGPTAMVGDGMNDAPALAAADVGISMGISGSAVAMETSHITLMSNDILKIPKAIRLARKTHRKIIANIIFSVITKIAILGLAIAGHPLLWAAVLADVGTCLIVILNSMMLLQTRTPKAMKKCHRPSHTSHVHKHENRCSIGDHCCKEREGTNTMTMNHKQCGAIHCSNGVHNEHAHRHAHEDKCSVKASSQTTDCVHFCGEAGRHTASTSHMHIGANGCGMEHHGEDVCDGPGAECHGDCHDDGAHFQCKAEHQSNAAHIQQREHVDCCNGNESKNHDHGVHSHCGTEHHLDTTCAQKPSHEVCCKEIDAEDHCADAHIQCEEHDCDVVHAQPTTNVSCCNGSTENIGDTVHIQCETEHHRDVECCAGATCSSEIPASNASYQHVVVIESEAEQHNQGLDEKHCHQGSKPMKHFNGHTEKKGTGGCCKTEPPKQSDGHPEKKETGGCCKTDASKHSNGHTEKKGTGGCCRTERKDYNTKSCCSASMQHGQVRREIDRCQKTEKEECTEGTCCSSSVHGGLRRESGGCCQSYMKECKQRGRCCTGKLARLPEIIIE